jgi:cell shape-determining protein MreC
LPAYGNEPETNGRRRDLILAGIVMILALSTSYLSEANQQRVAASLQVTVLRPFIATQEGLAKSRVRARQTDSLTAELDSLTAIVSTHSALIDENRILRSLLGLAERAGTSYLPATVLRSGTPGSESMFLVDVGFDDGVRRGAPVVSPRGLVGVIRDVRAGNSVGMDWSHPDFRASAMLADGTTYGMVESRRGRFREEDRLILNGIAYNQTVGAGIAVVTSGLGGVFPRGIPIGTVDGLADAQGRWRKSYWLRPMVVPGSATHVLVLRGGAGSDVSAIWPSDSSLTREEAPAREPGP